MWKYADNIFLCMAEENVHIIYVHKFLELYLSRFRFVFPAIIIPFMAISILLLGKYIMIRIWKLFKLLLINHSNDWFNLITGGPWDILLQQPIPVRGL